MSTFVTAPMDLPVADFAAVLFTTMLQESEHPAPDRVHAAVRRCLAADRGQCVARAVGRVAQEAGDHPEQAASRMRWALRIAGDLLPGAALAMAS
jgi:hypothetical protein